MALNVVKHATAWQATIELAALPGWLVLRVEDDGQGSEPATSTMGIDLQLIQNQVVLAGGTAQVLAKSGQGTKWQIRLPSNPF